ncbi:MAG: GNAT family N-acetyltransferase [Actinobacteria bacterium]|nr:GNAT family N-acetyltransferase [Actinomycetota bacterium]
MGEEVRTFEPAHLGEATALCAAGVPYLPFTPAILRERIHEDPDFDTELNLTVWADGRLVGLACGAPASERLQAPAGVKLFAVRAEHRRQGIATRMFDLLEARLAARGAPTCSAIYAGNNRFMLGLDVRYTAALCFLQQRGYARVGDGMDMDVDLRSQDFDSTALEAKLRTAHGIGLRRAAAADRDRVWAYVEREFQRPSAISLFDVGRRWAYMATMGLQRTPISLHLAERDGALVGFAVTDAGGPPGRLGPMGASPEVRGFGVGKGLLLRCLADLQRRGLATGVIFGAGPFAFYSHTVGARVSAVFWHLRRPLTPATRNEPW